MEDIDLGLGPDVPAFAPHSVACAGGAAAHTSTDLIEVTLEHTCRRTDTLSGEMRTRKLYLRAALPLLKQSERLATLLRSAGVQRMLHVPVNDEYLNIEAIAQAIEWQSLSTAGRQLMMDGTWPQMCGLMQAAAWLGFPTLQHKSESVLCEHLLRIDNVVPLARAAERCGALRLHRACFFMLKAFFCAESDEGRPRRHGKGPMPRLTPQAIRQGNHSMPHASWTGVIKSWRVTGDHLRGAQPCYTLCTLTRERHEEDGQPSVFRLVSEHDGRLLLVARQRWAGEGDFFIFAYPDDDDGGGGDDDYKDGGGGGGDRGLGAAAQRPSVAAEPVDGGDVATTETATDVASVAMAEAMREGSSGSRADLDAEFDALAPDPLAGAKQTGDGPDPLSAALAAGGANDAGDGTETDLGDVLAAVPPAEAMHALGRSDDGCDGTKGSGSDGSDARRGGQLSPPATAETERAAAAARAQRRRQARADAFVASIAAASPDELPEHSAAYRGCVSARWLGLQFSLFDGGLRPEHQAKGFPFVPREELASVTYASNLLKSRPHSLSVVLKDTNVGETSSSAAEEPHARPSATVGSSPSVEGSTLSAAAAALVAGGGSSSLYERSRSGQVDGLHVLQNQMPQWDPKLEAYTLPFYQRVVLPSKKNVHVVQPDAPDTIVMLFGKRSKSRDGRLTTFSLDFCRPVSTLAAFGIALTSFFGST